MKQWKVNIIVLWFGQFLINGGMTMVIPFLALYLKSDLGVQGEEAIFRWTGFIFAANFFTAFLFQPMWGKLADTYGRKMMLLRSGLGMSFVVFSMGFAQNPWHLLGLRLLNGTISGFNPASVSLISSTTPAHKMGMAMGISQSGQVAGTILGPLIGGLLVGKIGFRGVFFVTGVLLFLASILTLLFVKENKNSPKPLDQQKQSVLEGLRQLCAIPKIKVLFSVTFMLQFAMMSPISLLPLYVQHLQQHATNIAFWAGIVSAVTGMSTMIASPLIGKLSDKIGAHYVLFLCLLGTCTAMIPQAWVSNLWQLIAIRSMLGLFIGGLLPSIHALLQKYTPVGMESRTFSFHSSILSLGNTIGALSGGFLSGHIGIKNLFVLAGVLLLVNVIWVYFQLCRINGTRYHLSNR